MTSPPTDRPTDPLTAEVFRNALAVAAEEAGIVVVRGAHSTFIVEGADAAAAVLDAEGHLVAQSQSTSLSHAASLRSSLPPVLARHPAAGMAPGDVFVTNDVYGGGIHANDLIVFRPVFVEGEARWFTGTLIHVADLGGLSAGGMAADATDVFLEGLQLPPVRLATAEGPVADIEALLAANSRQPDKLLGDVRALVAGTAVAARRVDELVAAHGPDGFAAGVTAAWDYAERRMRQEIAGLADGTYRGAYPIDDDGQVPGRELWVRVTAEVAGDTIRIDFTGTDDQVPAAVNAGASQVLSGVLYAVRSFVDATIPMNEGCFRPIEVVLPEGSLVNPTRPYPGGGRHIAVCAAVEALYEALAQASPEHTVAASGILQGFSIGGRRPDGRHWLHMAFDFGGSGARRGLDGLDAAGGLFGGGRNLIPQVEPIEAAVPLRFEAVELIPDSGGAGRWRGGRGTRTVIELLDDALVDTRGDRLRLPPPGRDGGSPGRPGSYRRRRPDGTEEVLPAKATNLRFERGDRFVMETSGGGGLGAPPPGA
ncbi:MAG TPA: hydantoinase B/oxoprolinase family protein [Acidimicrobiales bacterium]